MPEFDSPEVNEALVKLTSDLIEQFPEVGEVIARLQIGELDEATAMRDLMAITTGKTSVVERLAEDAFQPLRGSATAMTPVVDGPKAPLDYQVTEHVKALNPLVEAAIAERAQFDGDVPELRTGPMPPGATPAVPVLSGAASPVALGVDLATAAQEVRAELGNALEDHVRGTAALLEDSKYSDPNTALQIKDHLPPAPTGVSGYQAGQTPALRKVESASGSTLATLSDSQRQQAAYKALSTTQGRRSAVRILEEAVLAGLIAEGWELASRTPTTKPMDVPIYAEWTSQVTGEEETNANFDFIAVAGRSILRQLADQIRKDGLPERPVLEVLPKNTVNVRQVGWAARIVSDR